MTRQSNQLKTMQRDGEYVLHEDLAPTLDAEELRKALWPIREAQVMLEDNHPNWNEEGQRYAIAAACEKLRDAHNRVGLLYAALIGVPNSQAQPRDSVG